MLFSCGLSGYTVFTDRLLVRRVGDRVFGQVMGGMASHVIADSRTLVLRPENLSAIQASTVPTTFLTAYECLMSAAEIKAGTEVLIHAATGIIFPI